MRQAYSHPALTLLMYGRWDDALVRLHAVSTDVVSRARLDDVLRDYAIGRNAVAVTISAIIEELYAVGKPAAGALALAWSMLTCDPQKPATFIPVLPQLQYALNSANLPADDDGELRRRLRTWWNAADGDYKTSKLSIFRLADPEAECWPDVEFTMKHPPVKPAPAPPAGPSLVVMPASKASKLNSHNAHYKSLIDAPLPLIVVDDVQRIRTALHREFPHAVAAVDVLIRDLRDGKPFRVRPVVLVGSPGSGKSRLVRRLAALVSESRSERPIHVHLFDGTTSDGQFSGTAKGWGNTEPSVPTRAVQQSMTANPVVMIDEIDKAKESHNGYLAHALLSFTDPETSSRIRDQSLDAELDLSRINYIATANDAKLMPGMLRDRFRMIRMPTPTLAHLPALAAQVIEDLGRGDEARTGDAPLADDELVVIGKAWRAAGFSMRKLKAIVLATLETRDSCAPRH